MKPQLDPTEKNKRKITKRRENTNLIRKNCKEIWKYISERQDAGKRWGVWFPILMSNSRMRWVLGQKKTWAHPLSVSEWPYSSCLKTDWKKFYTRHYKGESHDDSGLSPMVKSLLTRVLESKFPLYNERIVDIDDAIGDQASMDMFCWHHSKGLIYWDSIFLREKGKTAQEIFESFTNVVMSDTLDHAL